MSTSWSCHTKAKLEEVAEKPSPAAPIEEADLSREMLWEHDEAATETAVSTVPCPGLGVVQKPSDPVEHQCPHDVSP